jgi:pyruvate/2-oxoglutarate/acetoin dehydrogenase E1 component/TPP-dependent pyruvate/acetoin dehydrogenase alpha subunit
MEPTREASKEASDLPLSPQEILEDYRIAYRSRQASLIGHREVMSGKAKFGIFGDGKELPQIAMAKVFRKGDWRSGYYRDQTLMFALGLTTVQQFFAQLYAHTDVEADPATAGRAMNAHFATRSLDPSGSWVNLMEQVNSAADLSPTAAQMPRLVGLAYASRLYRELPELGSFKQFSDNGNEIAFGTIGNASCAEGLFWEALNAIGVLGAPALIAIYDDGYGISVENEQQMIKGDLSELLRGFQRDPGRCWGYDNCGYDIYTVPGWDYPRLVQTFRTAAAIVRSEHAPAIVHVNELTQPQGHSTSGSHERYKSKERLAWEQEFDCLKKFREWIEAQSIATPETLDEMEAEDRRLVEAARKQAWQAYIAPIEEERRQAAGLIEVLGRTSANADKLGQIRSKLLGSPNPLRREIMAATQAALTAARGEPGPARQALVDWVKAQEALNEERYSSHLYSQSAEAARNVPEVKPAYSESSPLVYGFEVLNACFDAALKREPRLVAFGQDVGRLGDVNQGMRGMQEKHGYFRVTDTGIREATIVGQAIGLALRGLRPIAEIQYLDYLLYALQILSDDLATLHWRTKGGQKAPVIVRTRGHRLEGVWHSGSLMAGIIHLARGMHVLVPRDMTRAAGFYNTLLRCDEPALVVEVLNGYRLRERLPDNISELSVPLGVPEVIRPGADVTLVTYGACCRIAMEAAEQLSAVGVETEVIDVQSLLPFDVQGRILESLKKTSRILFVDEDVPGGTTAYIFQQVLEVQGGYYWLDSPARTLPAKPHRPAYGSDGDYFSKPNAEQIFKAVYEMMNEVDPAAYPLIYK